MIVKEHHYIICEKHPYFKSLNKKLLEECEGADYSESYKTNVKAKHSGWKQESPTIDVITSWITHILHTKYSWICTRNIELWYPEVWFAEYSKNEYTVSHDHVPFAWSFVYFIQCPKGSAPLIFTSSGKRIKAEEGKVVIFPGNVNHYVPNNKCNGRIVMAGNIHC